MLDIRRPIFYNEHRKGATDKRSAPKIQLLKISRLSLDAEGGFSYALMELINAMSKNTNAKKSYSVISIRPFPGLGLTVCRIWQHQG